MVLTERVLDLDADHLDVALRVSLGLPDSSLIAHPLLDLMLIGVASPDYLRTLPPLRRPADLEAHRIVFMGATRGRLSIALQRVDGRRGAVEVRLQSAIAASNLLFTKEVALAGGGIAFVPTVIVAREIADGRLVRVLASYSQPGSQLYLVHSGGRFMPAKVRVFRDFMLEAFGVKGRRGPSPS